MANRFTATEKWVDPWFCSLNNEDKLFWIYIVDNCNHAGIWQVNFPLVEFHIKGFKYNKEVFKERIVEIKSNKWFIPKFIDFQYKKGLNPLNRAHASVIDILEKEGASKGLASPKLGCKDKDKDMVKVKAIAVISSQASFLTLLKNNDLYKHIDIDHEVGKMKQWIEKHPNRRLTEKFAINWLNKIDKPLKTESEWKTV